MTSQAPRCALAALTLVLLAGCEREDPAVAAIRKSSTQVQVLGGGSGPGLPAAQQKTYGDVVKALDAAAGSGDRTGGSAAVLVARSQLGLAEALITDAEDKEREASASSERIRARLAAYIGRTAAAASAESFDPTREQDDIRRSRESLKKLLDESKAKKDQIDAQVAQLRARVAGLNAGAEAKFAEYASMTREAANVSATQGDALVTRANEIKREGDALRLQAQKIDAEADSVAPLAREWALKGDQARGQLEELTTRENALSARVAAGKQAATEARADASLAANDIDKGVKDLLAFRAEEVDKAFERAQRALSAAVSAAKKASSVPEQGKLALGSANQAQADLHWSRAHGLGALASMLDGLAKVKPELPGASEYAAKAADARKAQEEALKEVDGAFESAKSAFGSAPIPGKAKEKLRELAERLGRSAAEAGDAAKDAGAAAGGAPAAAMGLGDNVAPAPAGGAMPDDLRQVLTAQHELNKQGKFAEMIRYVNVPDDELRTVMVTMGRSLEKIERLDKAFMAKYQKSLKEASASSPVLSQLMRGVGVALEKAQKSRTVEIDQYRVEMNGDTATVHTPVDDKPDTFKKIGGVWLEEVEQIEQARAMAPMINKMFVPMAAIFEEVAGEVEGGRHATSDEAVSAIEQKLVPLLQQLQGGGAGG